jgi:predicted  nucleic acid-binding Zn-ribbon protein
MKKKATTMFTRIGLTIYVAIGLMVGTLLAGCGKTSEQKVEAVKQELKDAKADYLAEWQTFKRESEQTIEANEKRIDAFKEKMEKAGSKVKAKYSKEVAVLEQKNRDLKKKLEEYKDEGQSKWQEFKTNFKHDMDAIGKTISDLFKDNG